MEISLTKHKGYPSILRQGAHTWAPYAQGLLLESPAVFPHPERERQVFPIMQVQAVRGVPEAVSVNHLPLSVLRPTLTVIKLGWKSDKGT